MYRTVTIGFQHHRKSQLTMNFQHIILRTDWVLKGHHSDMKLLNQRLPWLWQFMTYCNLYFTSTLVVMWHQTKATPFSMSASIAFSCWCRHGLTCTQVHMYTSACDANTCLRCKHRTNIAFMWHEYQSTSETEISSKPTNKKLWLQCSDQSYIFLRKSLMMLWMDLPFCWYLMTLVK